MNKCLANHRRGRPVGRYICIKHPRLSSKWCTVSRAKLAVFLVYFVTVFICAPNCVSTTVVSYNVTDSNAIVKTPTDSLLTSSPGDNATAVFNSNDVLSPQDGDQFVMVWNVDFKANSAVDRFIQSFNFWIQVKNQFIICVARSIQR